MSKYIQIDHSRKRRNFLHPEKISSHLRCSICINIFDNPVRTICGHTFCYVCIENQACAKRKCPICKVCILGRQLEKDMIAFKLIHDLPVRCSYPACTWSGLYSQMKKHQASCSCRSKKVVDLTDKEIVDLEDCSIN